MSGPQDAPAPRRPRRLSRWFTLALTLLATFFLFRALAPPTLGETARRHFLSQLQDHYRGYEVSIRRGHFDPDVGLVFEDLRIAEAASSTFQYGSREMVRIERMTVVAEVHPELLIDKKIPLVTKRVVMDGVQANAWLSEGKISLAALIPLPNLGPVTPRMDLRRVSFRLLDGISNDRPINAEFENVTVLNTPSSTGDIDQSITIQGSTDFANGVLVKIEKKGGQTDLRCAVQGAFLSRDLYDRLPSEWSTAARHARDLQCVCDATLALHTTAGGDTNYQLRTTVHEGRFSHPSLPKPISHLRGIVNCDPEGISIEASHGTLGDAVVRATGRIDGYRWPCDAVLNLSTRGLLLDERFAATLPPSMQSNWDRLKPLGRIDIDAKIAHVQSQWKTDATIICKGVDVRYDKFPYPIESLVGKIVVRDNIASTQLLDGRIGGNRMQCAFRAPIRPGITNEKSFVIATDGAIPIDRTLIKALSPRGRPTTKLETFARSLSPRGSVHLATAKLTTDASGRPHRKIDLRIIDGHLRYDKFAYPLYNVSGKLQVDDELVQLVGFRATNANAGVVMCNGSYRMPAANPEASEFRITDAAVSAATDSQMSLNFRANNIPMDEALRSSLPLSTRQTWDAISPSGVLDELTVTLNQQGVGTSLDLDVTARQRENGQVTNRSLSLRPTALPYRIDVVDGTVRFDGSEVTIESINGKHDASTLSADGRCVQDENGRWELLLNLHSGSRLHPDAELIAAIPSQMREAMRRLQLRGPVSVRGQTRLALPDATHAEPSIQWDLVLQLEGNRIADVGPVHSLRGEVSVRGVRDEMGIRALGDVGIDSMHVYDLQITGIRGPFSIEGDRLLLGGQSVDRKIEPANDDAPARRVSSIRGKLFDGTIDMDGEVVLSSGGFDVGLAVRSGKVPTLLADFGQGDNELTGAFSGQAQLQGNLGSADLLKGSGAARVSGANLYKLPLIVKVLNLLRVTPTKDVAFTDGEVEFTIFGDTMTFNDLQIWGDLVTLHGGGTLDRRRELDLTFNTRVSPKNSFTHVFRPLRSQRYTLWTIDVRGPLHALEIERRALEGVGETLERLIPGMSHDESNQREESASLFGRWLR